MEELKETPEAMEVVELWKWWSCGVMELLKLLELWSYRSYGVTEAIGVMEVVEVVEVVEVDCTYSHVRAEAVVFKDWLRLVTIGYDRILRSVTTKSAFKSILRYIDLILGVLVTMLR